jgi:hypothetical protein
MDLWVNLILRYAGLILRMELTYNTRLIGNNLLHTKYGLSVMYNNLRLLIIVFFETNGSQTMLQSNSTNPAINSIQLMMLAWNVYWVHRSI